MAHAAQPSGVSARQPAPRARLPGGSLPDAASTAAPVKTGPAPVPASLNARSRAATSAGSRTSRSLPPLPTKPAICILLSGRSWTNTFSGEAVASGLITSNMEGSEGWLRIQIGSLDQRIALGALPRPFGGRQSYFKCPVTQRFCARHDVRNEPFNLSAVQSSKRLSQAGGPSAFSLTHYRCAPVGHRGTELVGRAAAAFECRQANQSGRRIAAAARRGKNCPQIRAMGSAQETITKSGWKCNQTRKIGVSNMRWEST